MAPRKLCNYHIRKAYLRHLAESESAIVVARASAVIDRFEAANRYRDFRRHYRRQAMTFRSKLEKEINLETGERLSPVTIDAMLCVMGSFCAWLGEQPGYRGRITGAAASFRTRKGGRRQAAEFPELGPIRDLQPYILRPLPRRSQDAPVIFHAIGNLLLGGSSQLIVDLVERLSDDYRHEIVVPFVPDREAYQPLVLHCLPPHRLSEMYRLLARVRPSAVHVHYFVRESEQAYWPANWYRAVFDMCHRLGIPVIQNVNVPTRPHASPAVVHNVYVSHYVRDAYDDGLTASSVIYPGSDFSHFSSGEAPTDGHRKTIGMVYRLDGDKVTADSIDPFIEVARRRGDIRCLIVGDGPLRASYQRKVREAGLCDKFEFTGYVSYSELPGLYRRMQMFVAPVFSESFGQVTPFAMAMGLAVAGFDVGALREILGDQARLTPVGDHAALADEIVALLDDDDDLGRQGAANKARALENFSVEQMVASYRSLYSSVLQA